MLRRHLLPVLQESLRHFPVVLVTGARQAGKSTLVQMIPRKAWAAKYLTLDDRTTLDAALANPDGFLQEAGAPTILDEVQRAPDLLRAVKIAVDRNRRPGRFLLTGSANILTLATVSETLAGRVAVHELNPFCWAERKKKPPAEFIDLVFEARAARDLLKNQPWTSPPARRREIQDFIVSGGFPTPALSALSQARRTWFDSYRQTYIERDLRDIASLEHLPDFNRLLSTLALRTAQQLNVSALSRDVGLPATTLRRYFHILEQTYQVFLLPPFFANIAKRLVKTPKVYLQDTGLACHLSAVDRWETLEGQYRAGPMVETWVATELRKALAVASWRTELSYWRTGAGEEVDFLLERGGEVVGIEVKWGAGFAERDLAGLKACRSALGKRWRFGILLHGGTEAIAIDERTAAVPFGIFFGREEKRLQ